VSAKVAAGSAKKWLDEFLKSTSDAVEAKKLEIQSFVRSHENSDSDLVTLKRDMHDIRTKGPELQTMYETEHKAQEVPETDYTLYYTKAAALGGILALVAAVSVF
jgi:hypothetical protein